MKLKRTSKYLFILTAGCIAAYINFSYDNNIEDMAPKENLPLVSMRDIIDEANVNTMKSEVFVANEEASEEIIEDIIDEIEESEGINETHIEQIDNIAQMDSIEKVKDIHSIDSTNQMGALEKDAVVEVKQAEPTRGEEIKRVASDASTKSMNSYVLDIIRNYKIGGYPYLLNNDYSNYNGVTENLYYKGEILLKAEPSGNKASHCSGITFEVFFKAMQKRNADLGLDIDDFNGLSKSELYDMALTWYAAKGSKSKHNMATAVENYGMGYRITDMEKLSSGDFIDFSRTNNTGHTAVFINWIRDNNHRIIGFKYWSSQESTKGINYNEEYFNILDSNGKRYGSVMIDNLYMARIAPK